MSLSPVNRVRSLMNLDLDPYSHQPATSPTTLTGGPTEINSYQLTIAFKDKNTWKVYDHKNSPTTNRHINAVTRVLTSEGYEPTDQIETITAAWNRGANYRVYARNGGEA